MEETDDVDVMMILQSTTASVGIVANLTVVVAFLNHKKFRRKIPNMFIVNQVSRFFLLFWIRHFIMWCYLLTRMHSSRMRTARLLTVSRSIPCRSRGSTHPSTPRMQTPPPPDPEPPPWMHTPWRLTPPDPDPPCGQNERCLQKNYLAPNFVCGR